MRLDNLNCGTFWQSRLRLLTVVLIVGAVGTVSNAVGQDPDAFSDEVRGAAETHITERGLRAHIRYLSDDLLEGRGPGSRGDQLAQKYIATQLEMMGYEPAAPESGWFQHVPLVGLKTQLPPTITLKNGDASLDLKRVKDFMMTAGKQQKETGFADAELVFVGYGIQAPEYDWNDYKDVDVRGKVLLMMNNDPAGDPELFKGRTRLYYGRWDYKYQMAAKMGAAGAIIIHTTESAGYPYQVVQTSWSGEVFELRDQPGPRVEMQGWFTEDAARKVVELSGFDLDKLRQSAESRDFKPVPLKTTLSLALQAEVRELDTANVLGSLPGSDPELSKEFVIFMAHHDHIGMAATRDASGDNIYNGAVDNASGVASLLTIARAIADLPQRPKRSILIAAVAAEEQGLLGSKYMAQHPPVHAGYLASLINMDGINILGPTKDVNVIGLGKSQMDDYVATIAKLQNRVVTPDAFPDRGYYYRSDQFSLAKIGVPAVYLHSGVHVIGKPEGWGKQQQEDWVLSKYHQPSDEYDDSWDLRGGVEDTRLLLYAGLMSANAKEMPRWNPGDEFEAAREKAIAERDAVHPKATDLDEKCAAQIDAIVGRGIADGQMPGCVVTVGRSQGLLLLKAYGHRQIEPSEIAMTTDTVFDLASLTKPIATATSVMLLVERGDLKLDDPVSKHIPEFAQNEKGAVTVLQLLTHQSGLIADNALSDYADGPEQAMKHIFALPLKSQPGTKFIYSDVGFIVLGELVKRIANENLHEFTHEQIFAPLGMNDTGFLPREDLRHRAAVTEQREGRWMQGEVHDPRAHEFGGIAGHAGLFSTAEDLALYAQMLLKQGRSGDRQILRGETIDVMTAAYKVSSGTRGLGWDKRTGYSSNRGATFSYKAFGHGGFTGTALWIDPELDLYVIFLSNRLHPDGKGTVNPLAGSIGTVVAESLK